MDRRSFIKTSGVIAAQAVVFGGDAAAKAESAQPSNSSVSTPLVNPFDQEGQWYKAALHVHTTTSDGDVDVPTRIAEYRKLGYDIVAITDHWKTNDLSRFSDEAFLAISGMEAHPKTGTGAPGHHFVCLNLPHPFELSKDMSAQALIDKVISVGGHVIYAHPYWTDHTLLEMSEVQGYVGVEVFNGVCHLHTGKGFNNVHWDQILNRRQILPAVATDDVHSSKEINVGWTMIKAKRLGLSEIMESIAQGSYYASAGPTIEDYRFEEGEIKITSSPASSICFQTNGSGGGKMFLAEEGKTMTTAQWKPRKKCKWVRAEVVDVKGRHAWTNPIEIPEQG